MFRHRAIDLIECAFTRQSFANSAAFSSHERSGRSQLLGYVIAIATFSPFVAFAQTGNCRVTHVDYHERKALQSVQRLFAKSDVRKSFDYVLSSYPYVPVLSVKQQGDQSEAARLTPEIVMQNPDVVIMHGSTFTGSPDLRLELGKLIRNIAQEKGDIRGFVVYSSAPLDAADLSIDDSLRSKIKFMSAPIKNRFVQPDPSALDLVDKVKKLCGR